MVGALPGHSGHLSASGGCLELFSCKGSIGVRGLFKADRTKAREERERERERSVAPEDTGRPRDDDLSNVISVIK